MYKLYGWVRTVLGLHSIGMWCDPQAHQSPMVPLCSKTSVKLISRLELLVYIRSIVSLQIYTYIDSTYIVCSEYFVYRMDLDICMYILSVYVDSGKPASVIGSSGGAWSDSLVSAHRCPTEGLLCYTDSLLCVY